MKKIYLDNCCLNRPFDDQTKDLIRLESEAVLLILKRCEVGEWEWAKSSVLDFELEKSLDPVRVSRISQIAKKANSTVYLTPHLLERAEKISKLGFKAYASLHLAAAEEAKADVFLTTDPDLLKTATMTAMQLAEQVENPLNWLQEVTQHEQ